MFACIFKKIFLLGYLIVIFNLILINIGISRENDLDNDIYCLPREYLERFIDFQPIIKFFFVTNRLGSRNFDYFCWNQDGEVLIPHGCQIMSVAEKNQFIGLYNSLKDSMSFFLVVTAREMMLAKLTLFKNDYYSITKELRNNISHSEDSIRFYLFNFSHSNNLSLIYNPFGSPHLYNANYRLQNNNTQFLFG